MHGVAGAVRAGKRVAAWRDWVCLAKSPRSVRVHFCPCMSKPGPTDGAHLKERGAALGLFGGFAREHESVSLHQRVNFCPIVSTSTALHETQVWHCNRAARQTPMSVFEEPGFRSSRVEFASIKPRRPTLKPVAAQRHLKKPPFVARLEKRSLLVSV